MQAVVLCGGLATRLRPLSLQTPKILFRYRGRTILDWTLDYLKDYEVILAAGFLGEKIKDAAPPEVEVVIEEEPLGTGGAIKKLEDQIESTFIVMNGDIVTRIPLKTLVFLHCTAATPLATIALTVQPRSDMLDSVELSNHKVLKFGRGVSHLCNAGIYVLEPATLDLLPPGKSSLERDLFPILCEKRRLGGVSFNCPWWHIRDLSEYLSQEPYPRKNTTE